jgi:hypothetical protein
MVTKKRTSGEQNHLNPRPLMCLKSPQPPAPSPQGEGEDGRIKYCIGFKKMPGRRFRTGELFYFGVAVIAHFPPSP